MISGQERCAVAKRLRGIAGRRCYGLLNDIDILEDAIGCSIGQDWQDQDWWHRLADLIDRPTCKNESGYKNIFLCSECGARLEITAEEGNEYGDIFNTPLQPRFCPVCGAEVVE